MSQIKHNVRTKISEHYSEWRMLIPICQIFMIQPGYICIHTVSYAINVFLLIDGFNLNSSS